MTNCTNYKFPDTFSNNIIHHYIAACKGRAII